MSVRHYTGRSSLLFFSMVLMLGGTIVQADNLAIDYLAPESEDRGVAPEFFLSVGPRWVLVEKYDSEVHVFNELFQLISSKRITGLGRIADVRLLESSLLVEDEFGSQEVIEDIASIPEGSSGEAFSTAVRTIDESALVGFDLLADGTLEVKASERATLGVAPGSESFLSVSVDGHLSPVTSGGSIVDWRAINRLDSGEVVVLWSERQTIDDKGEISRSFVGIVGEGGLLAGLEVPNWTNEISLPLPVAVDSKARAVFLRISGGVSFEELVFVETPEFVDQVNSSGRVELLLDFFDLSAVDGGGAEGLPLVDPISRTQIVENANLFVQALTRLNSSNLSRTWGESCSRNNRHLLPARLSNAIGGSVFVGLPYGWGHWDSVDGYFAKIEDGALAGDICTRGRYKKNNGTSCANDCVLSTDVAGIDCSGLITRVWGLTNKKYGTSTLKEVATRLSSNTELKAGDILLDAGSHVFLVVSVSGPPSRYTIIDSSVSRGGVAQRTLTESDVAGYSPYRFSGIIE